MPNKSIFAKLQSVRPPSICGTGRSVLYHYSTYAGLAGIASSKSIWCTKIHYLNDSGELLHGLDILAKVCKEDFPSVEAFRDIEERATQMSGVNVFVTSFSEQGDLLSQWRGYAGGSGVSIALSFDRLRVQADSHAFILAECIYDYPKKVELTRNYIGEFIAVNKSRMESPDISFELAAYFIPIAAIFKNESFFEEQEWRLISPLLRADTGSIKVRVAQNCLIPYSIFDLRTGVNPFHDEREDICVEEVIVGPHPRQEQQMESIGYLFDSARAATYGVSRSFIPYRQL